MARFSMVVGGVFLAVALAACQPGPVAIDRKDEAAVMQMLPALDRNRSVLLVRVLYDGRECSGYVRLRRIVNGRVDTTGEVYVGNTNWRRSARELPGFKEQLRDTITLNFSERRKQSQLHEFRSKLVPITPGDYFVSFAECSVGNKRIWMGRDKNDRTWRKEDVPLPVSGANFIRIPAGVVVDAGYLEIKMTQSGFLFIDGKGTLISYEASASDKQMLQSNFPQLYAKMRFTSFSSYLAR